MYLLHPFPADLDAWGAVDTRIVHYPARAVGADEEYNGPKTFLSEMSALCDICLESWPVQHRTESMRESEVLRDQLPHKVRIRKYEGRLLLAGKTSALPLYTQ